MIGVIASASLYISESVRAIGPRCAIAFAMSAPAQHTRLGLEFHHRFQCQLRNGVQ
jgi:hypothetical protein